MTAAQKALQRAQKREAINQAFMEYYGWKCPDCNGALLIVSARKNPKFTFVGCSRYPKCEFSSLHPKQPVVISK